MAHCVTLVQLSVSCDHLIDKDIGSKSDPLCVLLQDVGGGNWTEVRRTMGLTSWRDARTVWGWKVRDCHAYWLLPTAWPD